jgi:ribosomal-protein-alanine N-acetyltransferase
VTATLETPRLLLRPMEAGDARELLAVFSDPLVMAAFASPPFGPTEMDAWVARNLEHQSLHGYGLFPVVLKSTGAVIGDCGLEQMDIGAELGYDLRSDRWNRGLATEAATAVRDYAFETLGLPRLVSLIRVGNGASRRVAEKVGMSLEARSERHGVDYWIFALDARAATRDGTPSSGVPSKVSRRTRATSG